MSLFKRKPLTEMSGEELEDFLNDLDWLMSHGVTPNMAAVIYMTSELIEVEIANRDYKNEEEV